MEIQMYQASRNNIISQTVNLKKIEKSNKVYLKKNKFKILLIEDNEINIHVATLLLNECGIKNILIAKNAKEAMKYFSSDIDLVILDIGLPDMSGIEVCKKMRKILKGKPLPIIACTASDSQEECLSAGFNDFILKPITMDDLEEIIDVFLLLKA